MLPFLKLRSNDSNFPLSADSASSSVKNHFFEYVIADEAGLCPLPNQLVPPIRDLIIYTGDRGGLGVGKRKISYSETSCVSVS